MRYAIDDDVLGQFWNYCWSSVLLSRECI